MLTSMAAVKINNNVIIISEFSFTETPNNKSTPQINSNQGIIIATILTAIIGIIW